jgi:ribosomal protein S18 acetylase RimI-like enzyme
MFTVRPYDVVDEADVLELMNADPIVGQPQVSAEMLGEAPAGRSKIDRGFWVELGEIRTAVMRDGADRLVGIVSFSVRDKDDVGVILWLDARQQESSYIRTLLAHALAELGRRTVLAFDFASALTIGLEVLPVRHRATIRRELERVGFAGEDAWRYIHRSLEIPWPTYGPPSADVVAGEEDDRWVLVLRSREGNVIGEATIGLPADGTGALWWIEIAADHRGRGFGRRLLSQCFDELAARGAREVLAFVDDDAPAGDPERDRGPANKLYDSMGFEEVDRLWSFTRSM